MRHATPLAAIVLIACVRLCAQSGVPDSDGDGLPDTLEDALLQRFAPHLYVSAQDCARLPARFQPGISLPVVAAEDGTLYGQAFPRPDGTIELHFYHLWKSDCGRMGHSLDTEHVSTLLRGRGADAAAWRAVYWYAAAHEDTVCDAGQVTRAATLHAQDGGATVWVSFGKHASYLNEALCHFGCGGDRCQQMMLLQPTHVINLGEAGRPAGGAVWSSSTRWPLAEKMTRSDFHPELLERVDRLPATDIAWAEPTKRPAQAAILGGSRGVDGVVLGGSAAGHGLAVGGRDTDTAMSVAAGKTGNALSRSVHAVGHALGVSAQKTGEAIGVKEKN